MTLFDVLGEIALHGTFYSVVKSQIFSSGVQEYTLHECYKLKAEASH